MLTIGSLFSGIGGIELGFEREGYETKWFVENNEFCQKVLEKNFPKIPIYGDITKLDFKQIERTDILTGGFPCQDISVAGKGAGITGERSGLWSYFAKAIRILQPKYAVIENVPVLTKRGLNVVLADLAKNGYNAEWFTLRASDFGALHKRERIFIVAYTSEVVRKAKQQIQERKQDIQRQDDGDNTANSFGKRYGRRSKKESLCEKDDGEIPRRNTQTQKTFITNSNSIRSRENANRKYVPTSKIRREIQFRRQEKTFITNDWKERIQRFKQETIQTQQGFSWCKDVRRIEDFKERPDIPQPLFRGSRDGISNWMDRIKATGNAVVPVVAQFIARRLKEFDKERI